MTENHNNCNKDNLGVVTDRLWKLQTELEDLENKLSKTVLSFQSFLEEKEEEPGKTNETVYEVKSKISTSKLEEKELHRTSAGVQKAKEKLCRTMNTVDDNDSNKPKDKTSDNFKIKNHTWKTCDYWSLPQWLQDNFYILKGYRPPLHSFLVCFLSIFCIHTETINIWSHLLGCLLFIFLFLHTAMGSLDLGDKLIVSPFFLGAIACLGFSSAFHTVHCHSQKVMSFFNRLDFCGITLLIVGSFVPWLCYGFFCENELKMLYLVGVLSLGICATIISLSETFAQPFYRPLRALVFVLFGLTGVIPGVHFIMIEGWEVFIKFAAPLLLSAVFYISGAVIYAVRVPERLFPGKCDILFQSHQIFHVLSLLATLFNYIGIVRMAMFAQIARNNPDFCLQRQFYYRT